MKTISPSAIKTFQLCPLKWWYSYVAKLPKKPQGAGAALGEKYHKQIEDYLLGNGDPREHLPRMSAEALESYLVEARESGGLVLVEKWMEPRLTTPSGVEVVGKADAIFQTPSRVIIVDHKFRSDVGRYAETEEELVTDPQAVLYSAWACQFLGAEVVEFIHHNHQTKGRAKFVPVKARSARDELLARFDILARVVDDKIAPLEQCRAEQVTPNKQACRAFGGCDFAAVCPHSPAADLRKLFEPNADTGKDEPMGILSMSENILPPDAPAVDVATPEQLKTLTQNLGIASEVKPPPEPAETAELGGEVVSAELAAASQAGARTKKTGRPPKNPQHPKVEGLPFVLCVDCYAPGARDLAPIVASIVASLAEHEGVADVRLAPKDSHMAYGGWRGMIAAAVREAFPTWERGVYLVSSSDLTDPAIEAIVPLASLVVRGAK